MLLVSLALAAPPPGRWYPEAEELEALGYAQGYEADGPESGVVLWDPARAWEGVNLYNSGHAPEALLVGMDGRVLHTWASGFRRSFPALEHDGPSTTSWRRVALRPADGHLLAIHEGIGVVHLDATSRVVWAVADRAHHEARWQPDGGVLVLTRVPHPGEGPRGLPLLEDCVSELDERGAEVHRVSILGALRASPWAHLLARAPSDTGDVLHTNSLAPLPDDPRRVLLSFRHLDALAVLDLDEERLVWAGTGTFSRQHDAQLDHDGRVLLFDNRGGPDGTSRVLALDPETLQPRWSYGGTGRRLHSDVLGAVQELPNGNLLVTESTRGRVVEITPRGEPVWEFHNPRVVRPGEETYVAAIYELVRLPPELPWLSP